MNLNNIFEKLVYGSGKGVTFTHEDRDDEFCLYDELREQSAKFAAYLKKNGVRRGDEVLVHSANLKFFVTSMWACFHNGYIAVPIDNGSNDNKVQTIKYILGSMKNPYVICDSFSKGYYFGEYADKVFDITDIDIEAEDIICEPPVNMEPDDVFYILHSSGSTGTPKNIVLSFKNAVSHAQSIIRKYKVEDNDVFVTWHPLTHCFGLNVFHLIPLIINCNQVFISTADFMKDPLLCFKKLDMYRGSMLGMLPFALKRFINYYKKIKKYYSVIYLRCEVLL